MKAKTKPDKSENIQTEVISHSQMNFMDKNSKVQKQNLSDLMKLESFVLRALIE